MKSDVYKLLLHNQSIFSSCDLNCLLALQLEPNLSGFGSGRGSIQFSILISGVAKQMLSGSLEAGHKVRLPHYKMSIKIEIISFK